MHMLCKYYFVRIVVDLFVGVCTDSDVNTYVYKMPTIFQARSTGIWNFKHPKRNIHLYYYIVKKKRKKKKKKEKRLGSSFLMAVVHGECFQLSNHDIGVHEKSRVYYLITH